MVRNANFLMCPLDLTSYRALKPKCPSLTVAEPTVSVLQTFGMYKVRVYERPDFRGQMLECTDDLNNLSDHWHVHEVHSAQVQDGAWVFFELPDYRGHQYLLERGEYRRFTEWAAMNPSVGSFRRVQSY